MEEYDITPRTPRQYSLMDVAVIALSPLREKDRFGHHRVQEMKKRFRQLKKEGYEVPDTSRMNDESLVDTYLRIETDVRGELLKHLPVEYTSIVRDIKQGRTPKKRAINIPIE